jgi:hypothetical protein
MLPRKTISWLFGSLTGFLIVLASSAVVAQTQPVRRSGASFRHCRA